MASMIRLVSNLISFGKSYLTSKEGYLQTKIGKISIKCHVKLTKTSLQIQGKEVSDILLDRIVNVAKSSNNPKLFKLSLTAPNETIQFIAPSANEADQWISELRIVTNIVMANHGQLIYQTKHFTPQQMAYISTTQKNPIFLFGDNDTDKNRDQNAKRQYFGGQASVMGKYDQTLGYGITTTFMNLKMPSLIQFIVIFDAQFKELKDLLQSGRDIIIPSPTANEILQNNDKYVSNGQQTIFHNIGTGIAHLPFDYVQYIQMKFNELLDFAANDSITEVDYYSYKPSENTVKYEEILLKMENMSSKMKRLELENKHLKKEGSNDESKEVSNAELANDTYANLSENEEEKRQRQNEFSNKIKKDNEENMDCEASDHECDSESEDEKKHEISECDTPMYDESSDIWEWSNDVGEGNSDNWMEYSANITAKINKLDSDTQIISFKCNIGQNQYLITKLSSTKAMQVNVATNTVRQVRRQPKRECPKWLRSMDEPGSNKNAKYPKPTLIPTDINSFDFVNLELLTNAFHVEITKIEGIKNRALYEEYKMEKILMSKKNMALNEKILFHKTTKKAVQTIMYQGLMKEFNQRAAYGAGTYYATSPAMAHGYTIAENGLHTLLVCTVITGECAVGKQSYKLANWPQKENHLIFDSLVDRIDIPSMYIIHQNRRAYPLFIISYRQKVRNDYSQSDNNSYHWGRGRGRRRNNYGSNINYRMYGGYKGGYASDDNYNTVRQIMDQYRLEVQTVQMNNTQIEMKYEKKCTEKLLNRNVQLIKGFNGVYKIDQIDFGKSINSLVNIGGAKVTIREYWRQKGLVLRDQSKGMLV